ncbi:MAG: tetratricopeptide repeat protein [Methylococcales bacterium]|nr:tetratricopeptide repeat protein [Methylococcales bacterium]
MKNRILLTLLLTVSLLTQAHAVDEFWDSLISQAVHNYDVEEYEFGLEWAHKALKYAEKNLGKEHPDTISTLTTIAYLYQAKGDLSSAEKYFSQSYIGTKKLLGESNDETLLMLEWLIKTLFNQQKYDEVTPLYRQWISVTQKERNPLTLDILTAEDFLPHFYSKDIHSFGVKLLKKGITASTTLHGKLGLQTLQLNYQLADTYLSHGQQDDLAQAIFEPLLTQFRDTQGARNEYVIAILYRLAVIHKNRQQYPHSESYYLKALALSLQLYGEESLGFTDLMANFAIMYDRANKPQEAAAFYKQLLSIYEQHADNLAARTTQKFQIMVFLATLYQSQHYFHLAVSLLEPALPASQQKLGKDNQTTLRISNLLVSSYARLNQYKQAVTIGVQTLALNLSVFGDRHIESINLQANLGAAYLFLGQLDEAESLLTNAWGLKKETLGEDHPETLASANDLALLYQEQGRYLLAVSMFKEVITRKQTALGKLSPRLIPSLSNLAGLYALQGQQELALKTYQQATELSQKIHGDNHPETLKSQVNLAVQYMAQHRFSHAETVLINVVNTYNQSLGETHTETLIGLNNLASAYIGQNKLKQAEAILLKLKAHYDSSGADRLKIITVLNDLGHLYHQQHRYPLAEEFYLRKRSIQQSVLGNMHADTRSSNTQLAALYFEMKLPEKAEALFDKVLANTRQYISNQFSNAMAQEIKAYVQLSSRSDSFYFTLFLTHPSPQNSQRAYNLLLDRKKDFLYLNLQKNLPHDSLNAEQVQTALQDNVLVEYYLYQPYSPTQTKPWQPVHILATVINKETVQIVNLGPLSAAQAVRENSHQLYEILIAPLADTLKPYQKIYVAPLESISNLPPSQLMQFLDTDKTVRTLISGRDLVIPPTQKVSL